MGHLENRVAIVTGAGRGLGRAHALLLAREGASVVVNDLGTDLSGAGDGSSPAEEVVGEIRAAGGTAVASAHDVADWESAAALIDLAVGEFGALHVLVNNAGITRDRTLANMSEEEWDAVIRVNLKGHVAPTRHALAYWRGRAKADRPLNASVIHTTSIAAFAGNLGQANYSAAKAAMLALSSVVSFEAGRYGVRSNAVSPSARSRLTVDVPGNETRLRRPPEGQFDAYDPANVSPLIAWLAEEDCPADAQVFHIVGNRLFVVAMPQTAHCVDHDGAWTQDALRASVPDLLLPRSTIDDFRLPQGDPS